MELEHKKDFAATQARWDSFWKGCNEYPLVSAVVPRKGKEPVDPVPYGAAAQGDFRPLVDRVARWAESREFLGDSIPFYYLEFAAVHFAALLGAGLEFQPDGHGNGWSVPVIDDLEKAEIRFRRDGYWWERTEAYARALRKACDGRILIASPTIDGGLDTLAALRGTERLLFDLVERPEAVRRAMDMISAAVADVLDAFSGLFDWPRWGSINRHGMYSRGRIAIPQCDFSCMISPDMYREFELPSLEREIGLLDASEYHLDGPNALRHLETLCGVEKLGVIQWVAGSGWGEAQDWAWLHKRIDDLGKGQIRGGDPAKAERIWRETRSRRQFIGLSVKDRDEALRAIDRLRSIPKPVA